eukprot:855533-Amorphochlora_amoeboformis.AAC.1
MQQIVHSRLCPLVARARFVGLSLTLETEKMTISTVRRISDDGPAMTGKESRREDIDEKETHVEMG